MNTMPDEELLALWVEDELDSASAAGVEAWAATQPEWLARREDARQLKALFRRANMPSAEEPPYADFFNSRISREIAREAAAAAPAAPAPARERNFFRWLLPATAVAGMALCFWAGTRLVPSAPAPVTVEAPPVLYTPEKGVNAEYFASSSADAEVIVLDGVAAIPDTFELPETASTDRGPAATADIDIEPR
ncbi:hypothetical protein OJ996_21460 [Luteolibacter sp. GHJ8]|uniref:Anti sigma-E protein RseA N-terminal domain-containing protein n=1 Tax=Luteolibacter rhizosphaerae TaxID=2989719 RepID=A0ABT3G960_9BACT|nr:hypothetical protein [Luteolibacter rhizosphaerae]MCW1916172.1 hypothetical protein [Luteolibacter rhizosphaerae]